MTPEQRDLARHALGLTRQARSYRNRFVTGPGTSDHAAGRAAIEAMEPFKGGISIMIGASITISTAYHPEIVNLFKSVGGKYDSATRRWSLPISAGTVIAARRDDLRDWHNTTVRADQAKAAEKTARRSNRRLVLADGAPAVGDVTRLGGKWMTVEGHGKIFRADENTSSIGGPIGAEGERVRYVYFRDATSAEIAEAEAVEAERAQIAEATTRKRAAIQSVADGEYAPETGREPDGDTIWLDDRHAATGYRIWIVRGTDGYLYHLTYDGSDGAAWGDYNAGYNTRARRVPETAELIEAITQ